MQNNIINIDRYMLILKHEIITSDGTHIEVDKPIIIAHESICHDPYKDFNTHVFNYVLNRLTDELRKYYLKENGYE